MYKGLLDDDFVISAIIKVEVTNSGTCHNTYLNFHYSGYQEVLIQ